MTVFTIIAAIWTLPEPSIFAAFNGFQKELAHNVGRRLLAALLIDDFLELLLIPILHCV